ncbi:MAG: hypothetical protein Q4P36_08480 [Bowdeniella nasicola]|nr:hypothetical protein [Bowdeniella nasicola]
MDHPVIEMIVFGLASLITLSITWVGMPNPRDKKTGRQRTLVERWALAGGHVRGGLIGGAIAGCMALVRALQLLGVLPHF